MSVENVQESQLAMPPVPPFGATQPVGGVLGRSGDLGFGPAEWEDTQLITVPVDQVRTDPEQPRKHFDEESLAELGWSLRVLQIQPIVVRREGSGWVLVDGERRWRAARLEGLPTLVAREINLTQRVELVTMVIQLAANTHRDQLTLEEQATGVLRLADGGLPVSAIARVLGHHEDRVVSLLAVARSGDARELITAGRLASVSAWDAYCGLDPPARRQVLDSTDPVTVERCERVRLEHERLERAKQQRLVMPRQARAVTGAPQAQLGAEPRTRPERGRLASSGDVAIQSSGGHETDSVGGSATNGDPISDAEVEAILESGECRVTQIASEGLGPQPPQPPQRTHVEALAALHDTAHDERAALVTGLDCLREQLDAGIAALAGHADITEAAYMALRSALAPVEATLNRALRHIVRPPELEPCCAQAFAVRHYQKEGDGETAITGDDEKNVRTAEQRS